MSFLKFFFSIFSSGGHFVQWSGTTLAILVEGHPRNISAKGLINHFKQLITHFLCEQVCEKWLCRHKLGTGIIMLNSTWFIKYKQEGHKGPGSLT